MRAGYNNKDLMRRTTYCKGCEEYYPLTSNYWYSHKETISGFRTTLCKECTLKDNKEWRKANPKKCADASVKGRVKTKYGITVEEYKRCMNTSDVCEICGETGITGSADKALNYDHNHKTMEFRGVLCRKCNQALGQFGDSIEGVQKALNYLQKENL